MILAETVGFISSYGSTSVSFDSAPKDAPKKAGLSHQGSQQHLSTSPLERGRHESLDRDILKQHKLIISLLREGDASRSCKQERGR